MKMLNDFLREAKEKKLNPKDYLEGVLISKGFVWNPIVGWEKSENLDRFRLAHDMTAVPSKKITASDGKEMLVASDNFMEYKRFKEMELKRQYAADAMAQSCE